MVRELAFSMRLGVVAVELAQRSWRNVIALARFIPITLR